MAFFTVTLLSFGVVLFLVKEGLPLLTSTSAKTLWSSSWLPRELEFGVLQLLVSSLALIVLTLLIAGPLSIASSVFMVFFCREQISRLLRALFEVFSAIPAVLVGMVGLTVVVPWTAQFFPPGFGLGVSALVLSLLLTPALTSALVEVFHSELSKNRLAALSLGLSPGLVFSRIVWPATRQEVLRHIGLTIGRGLGETLAVLMVCGNVLNWPLHFFDSILTLNSAMALEIPYAEGLHRSALFVLALITLSLSLAFHVAFETRETREK